MHSYPTAMEVPVQLTVIAYEDPIVDELGHGPESAYIELTRSKWIFEVPEFSSAWAVGGEVGD